MKHFKKSRIKFYRAVQELIDERIDLLREGITPEWTDLRSFFYATRLKFQNDTGLIDNDSTAKSPYTDWQSTMNGYIEKFCPEFEIPTEHRWRLRERLNIWPKGKAICQTYDGERFLIERENRKKVIKECSFVLLCEKDTVSRQLIEELSKRGYQFNHVATGGFSTTDVQEVAINIAEEMGDTPNFYLLILHDYDLDGIKIYFNLKQRYGGIIDVGINKLFLESMAIDLTLVEESKVNKNHQGELEKWIADDDGYDTEDFAKLQGHEVEPVWNGRTKKYEKRWEGRRIEIDSIHTRIGIESFADFIEATILEKCTVWDLRRIGISPSQLREPDSLYFKAIIDFTEKPRKRYQEKRVKIDSTIGAVQEIINKEIQSIQEPFIELREQVWESWADSEFYRLNREKADMNSLLMEYQEQRGREWIDDDDVVEEMKSINNQLEFYEGDVRLAKDDLRVLTDEQKFIVRDRQKADEDLEPFKEQLEDIDWKEEDLDELKVPEEAELIHQVIDALQEQLKVINNDNNDVGGDKT